MRDYVAKYRAATQHEGQMQSEFSGSQMQIHPAIALAQVMSICLNDKLENWQNPLENSFTERRFIINKTNQFKVANSEASVRTQCCANTTSIAPQTFLSFQKKAQFLPLS
jgi:hypothetical protein